MNFLESYDRGKNGSLNLTLVVHSLNPIPYHLCFRITLNNHVSENLKISISMCPEPQHILLQCLTRLFKEKFVGFFAQTQSYRTAKTRSSSSSQCWQNAGMTLLGVRSLQMPNWTSLKMERRNIERERANAHLNPDIHQRSRRQHAEACFK